MYRHFVRIHDIAQDVALRAAVVPGVVGHNIFLVDKLALDLQVLMRILRKVLSRLRPIPFDLRGLLAREFGMWQVWQATFVYM